MRLIDADALIEAFKVKSGIWTETSKYLIKVIDEQPTAYDVDAVVAEIQKAYCKKCRNILGVAGAEAYCKEQKCDIYAVYDIVRKGGVE